MLWAEQAVFTSIRGSRMDGYQLAATSPGINSDLARELTQWGPAHDSLYDPPLATPSISWFQLTAGQFCLAVTRGTSGEYSGRSGPRVYTHFLVLAADQALALANPAWQIYRALDSAGRFLVRDPLPERLERCPVTAANSIAITPTEEFDTDELLEHLEVDGEGTIAVICHQDANAVLESLWRRLPENLRQQTSFSTGLRYSLRRPFRIQTVPNDASLLRQLGRESRVKMLNFAVLGQA